MIDIWIIDVLLFVCTYVYVCIYIYIYTRARAHTHTHTHTCAHACMYAHVSVKERVPHASARMQLLGCRIENFEKSTFISRRVDLKMSVLVKRSIF